MIFRFRKFPVYQKAREFRRNLKKFSRQRFPKDERYALTDQLWRALNSILLNIAEGSSKFSDIEFSKFLNTALTSLDEVAACLDIAFDDGYLSEEEYHFWDNEAESLNKQLSAFSSKVRSDARNKKRSY